jgi:hypothetical protein
MRVTDNRAVSNYTRMNFSEFIHYCEVLSRIPFNIQTYYSGDLTPFTGTNAEGLSSPKDILNKNGQQ